MSSSLTAIAMSHHPFEIFAHHRALRENAGQQEREKYGEPAVDRKARIETDWMRRSRNGLADGSMQRVLTDPTAEEFAWAPDGRRVAFHSRRDGQWGIYVLLRS